jgi:hypothetical protein
MRVEKNPELLLQVFTKFSWILRSRAICDSHLRSKCRRTIFELVSIANVMFDFSNMNQIKLNLKHLFCN